MPGPPQHKRILESCPNLFQLLELVEDHGPGVEKFVISQESFGRLLNLLQPECYESISKIDLKSLDKLLIKPTGIYGDPVEMVMFLERVGYLDANAATLLSQAIESSGPVAVLSSGLYLGLDPKHGGESSKSVYIIYWPEETTWKDQLATPSVRYNRTMFMRYLTKLTDQILACVSLEQARGFDWDAHLGQPDHDTDEGDTRSNSPPQIQQEASESSGFAIHVGPEYFPNGTKNIEARLVPGEDKIGLLVVSRNTEERGFEEILSGAELRKWIESSDSSFQLGRVSPEDVAVLAAHGLREKYSNAFEIYDQRLKLVDSDRIAVEPIEKRNVDELLQQDKDVITTEVHRIIETIDGRIYPSLGLSAGPSESRITAQMRQKYPSLGALSESVRETYDPSLVKDEGFQNLKFRWLSLEAYFARNPQLSEMQRSGYIDYIFNRLPVPISSPSEGLGDTTTSLSIRWIIENDPFSSLVPEAGSLEPEPRDPEFISSLSSLESKYPPLSRVAQQIRVCLWRFLTNLKNEITEYHVTRVLLFERERLRYGQRIESEHQLQDGQKQAFEGLLRYLQRVMATTITTSRLRLDRITKVTKDLLSEEHAGFHCVGYLSSLSPTRDHYSIHTLGLTSVQSDRIWPNKTKLIFEFNREEGQFVEFLQLILDKCLVVISDRRWMNFYIGSSAELKHWISTNQSQMKLKRDALGSQQCMFAFDQATRLLAIIHSQKDDMKLSVYHFDEHFANLTNRGSPILLKKCYSRLIDIERVCFVSGIEELCFIGVSGYILIFSLVTQQFRNASLQIDRPIVDSFSAPDGSCLLVAVVDEKTLASHQLLAFHWASFGTNQQGINSTTLPRCDGYRAATRFDGRGNVHVVSFSRNAKAITSTILQITQKATHCSLYSGKQSGKPVAGTVNNSLIDCHREVWTQQLPIVPAVERSTLASTNRQPRQLIFVSPVTLDDVESYFVRMRFTYEMMTQKPIGREFNGIKVESTNLGGVNEYFSNHISELKLGSFIVDLLSLIPWCCGSDHRCVSSCEMAEEHSERESCGLLAGHGGRHICDVKAHSCGQECHLIKMGGCIQSCTKPLDHEGEHMCSARAHLCGKPCDLRNVRQGHHQGLYSCPGICNAPWDEPHEHHACENSRACPIECTLCGRLCCSTDHFHGLDSNASHLCGQEHNCSHLCEADGICQIETRPSAIQDQFSDRHESFVYTRYTQVDRRLSCVIPIPSGELEHDGLHTHDTDENAFHFCDARCPNCEYLCTLPLGHGQQFHETSHGSMITTQWVLQADGDDEDPAYELQGRKFGSGDEGAPMLCNLVCAAQGRHAHIDFCRDPGSCSNTDCEHILERMHPDPDRPKDWISHATFWARSGFKDPYSQDEQNEFSKCDVLCSGPEHEATATNAAIPSYCTLPIFHPPEPQQPLPLTGHVSRDGHAFDCQNPSRLHQAYHIIFVIDSSGSMTCTDRGPLTNTPISAQLTSNCNNRYGAVLSALYGFWLSRDTVAAASTTQARQDAYSVITFDHYSTTRLQDDFTSTTDQLIGQLIPQTGKGGTNFQAALAMAQSVIEAHWSSDRSPVIVFLSDGECNIADNPVYDLCHTCVRLGKALAFHSVSFGTDTYSASLRRMAEIAHEVYASAPQDVLTAARGNPCAYTNAIDSIQLADTFLGIANSLQKPRASLMNQYGSGGRRAIY